MYIELYIYTHINIYQEGTPSAITKFPVCDKRLSQASYADKHQNNKLVS